MYKTHSSSKRCRICFCALIHNQPFLEIVFGDDVLCLQCRSKLQCHPKVIQVNGMSVFTLYVYEGQARTWFLQYKEGHDRLLAPIFLYSQRRLMKKKYGKMQIVTAPSHENAIQIRGFSVVDEMIRGVLPQPIPAFQKTRDVYQKSLSRSQRFENQQDFILNASNINKNSPLLLIDDLITTGATLASLYRKLLKKGCKVEICSIYRHKNLE